MTFKLNIIVISIYNLIAVSAERFKLDSEGKEMTIQLGSSCCPLSEKLRKITYYFLTTACVFQADSVYVTLCSIQDIVLTSRAVSVVRFESRFSRNRVCRQGNG